MNKADTRTYIEDLVTEADSIRQYYVPTWQQNVQRYSGIQWENDAPEGLKQITVNRTQTAVIATSAVMTERNPRAKFNPTETNEPAPIFINAEKGQYVLAALIDQNIDFQPLSPNQLVGYEPLIESQVVYINGLLEKAGADPIQPSDFTAVTDNAVAKACQKVFDKILDISGWDSIIHNTVQYSGIIGHQALIPCWNYKRNRFDFELAHPFHIWIDPHAKSGTDAHYIIWDQLMSADEAKSKFPEFSKAIDQYKESGLVNRWNVPTMKGGMGDVWPEVQYSRDMVVLRTAWLRHQEEPIEVEEAIREGFVKVIEEQRDAEGNVIVEGGYMLTTGEPEDMKMVKPGTKGWPTEVIVRQVRIIGDTVVEDEECPYKDIPCGWFINLQIPFRPYGYGEPERLFDVQNDINRIMSIYSNHFAYYQSPQEVMSQSMWEKLNKNADTHARPGRTIICPDEQFEQMGGNVTVTMQLPQIPNSYANYLGILLQEHDRLSGHVEALRGETPANVESGLAIEALQSAARGPIGLRARLVEHTLRYLVPVMLDAVLKFLPEIYWQRYMPSVPIQVIRAIRTRAKDIDWDLDVEISAGRLTNRIVDEKRAIELRNAGLLSLESVMERLNVPDAKAEMQRLLAELSGQVPGAGVGVGVVGNAPMAQQDMQSNMPMAQTEAA